MRPHSVLSQLELKQYPVEYLDIRLEETHETSIMFANSEQLQCQEYPSLGAFIRIYHNGRWHESATTQVDDLRNEIGNLVERALASKPGQGQKMQHRQAEKYNFESYNNKNCTHVTLEQKNDFCKRILEVTGNFSEIVDWGLTYSDRYKQKWFMAKDGVEFYSDYNQAGVRLRYSLKRDEKLFDDVVNLWFMNHLGLESATVKKFEAGIKESLKFLDAESIKAGKYQVLLSPEVTGVFTHESFGHKSEADFMLGDETMLKEWTIGKKVAADHISIVDEGDSVGTSGYCPIDDEGNRKQKTYLIKDGKLAGRLHSASTALALGETNTGNGRAMNFEFGPIVRMTNTYIEPGSQSLEQIISNIKNGVYIKDFKHGMGMSTFTIAPGKAYMIEDGEITRPVKVSVISGSVFETLMNIKAVANDFEVKSSAFGGCGKFEQWPLPVADGGPSILVDGMQVS